jgi:hypothetical protein
MARAKIACPKPEETPVDDVRRVRERLSEAAGNDVNRLADRSRKVAESLRAKLGLKPESQWHP